MASELAEAAPQADWSRSVLRYGYVFLDETGREWFSHTPPPKNVNVLRIVRYVEFNDYEGRESPAHYKSVLTPEGDMFVEAGSALSELAESIARSIDFGTGLAQQEHPWEYYSTSVDAEDRKLADLHQRMEKAVLTRGRISAELKHLREIEEIGRHRNRSMTKALQAAEKRVAAVQRKLDKHEASKRGRR